MDAPVLDLALLQEAVQPRSHDPTPVPQGEWPTVTDDGVQYLSPSGRDMYENCTQAWKYRYLDRLPTTSSADQVTGTFLHAVMEQVLLAQMQGDDWSAPALGDAVRDAIPMVIDSMDADLVPGFTAMQDATVAAAVKAWALWHARGFEAVEVERSRTVFVGDLQVHGMGIMDVLADTPAGRAVIDWKFPRKGPWHKARRTPSPLGELTGDMRDSHALACSMYAEAAEADGMGPVQWIATIHSPRAAKEPAWITGLPWDRDRTQAVQAAWTGAINGIRARHFTPKAKAKWLCNEKFCDFWSVCPGGAGAETG